jgi:hypothetical protein
VMDCGDTGHILLSKHVAEDLEDDAHWHPLLHDLGQCEVKHGVRVGLVNVHDAEIGNPQLPEKVRKLRKKAQTNNVCLFSSAIALSMLVAGGTWLVSMRLTKKEPAAVAIEEATSSASTPGSAPTATDSPGMTFAQTNTTGFTWPNPPKMSHRPVQPGKLFAGTWHGTIHNAGPKGRWDSDVEFTIDDTEKHFTNQNNSGSVTRRGQTLSYSRSYKLSGSIHGEVHAELTLQGDGKTATYSTTQTNVTGKVRSITSGTGTVTKVD